ncbi:hypothetical protein SODALDRAFT_355072 [Sodiomyces alkalinus F11]|uniref:Uncharacterized protein n=1 Tax=Sodiomyces alkalinus (strain CBS 110278 / VKM F-3762 / F11) TaxID=1314773 RepID=A0A3N2Q7X4_SODAK|nr:hypothetical protein SODALDRAFT_355072 [Sodiomyces alkalinus F11]ROT42881.1 hypothetical protein SODALDRAFT_355072 [Sodiomyces alkalinus F11]
MGLTSSPPSRLYQSPRGLGRMGLMGAIIAYCRLQYHMQLPPCQARGAFTLQTRNVLLRIDSAVLSAHKQASFLAVGQVSQHSTVTAPSLEPQPTDRTCIVIVGKWNANKGIDHLWFQPTLHTPPFRTCFVRSAPYMYSQTHVKNAGLLVFLGTRQAVASGAAPICMAHPLGASPVFIDLRSFADLWSVRVSHALKDGTVCGWGHRVTIQAQLRSLEHS